MKKSPYGNYIPECYIDNVANEENKDIGFDLSLLKRTELRVNLIHFDLNMKNAENYKYYNNFKVDVVGGFYAMDNLDMFQKYLEQIKNKNIPFLVISSGSSGKDVIPICLNYPFVKEVIIFCANKQYNEHYLYEYPEKVKKVLTKIEDVYNYIKTFANQKGVTDYRNCDSFIFSPEDIQMNKQFEQCPVISAYEYDKCYFLIHRAYAHFFGNIYDRNEKVTFPTSNYEVIKKYINNSKIIKGDKEKNKLIEKFKSLENNNYFIESSLRKYTGESNFCYIFNRTMRNFEEGLISLAYYMGPFLFGVNKYVKEHNQLAMKQDMQLYRNIQCSIYDFYLYKLNLHHIICFPSITSTSTVSDKFHPSPKAKALNIAGVKENELIKIKMIFNYKHEEGNISPGIILKNNKGNDGEYLSSNPTENEVILFPFTFVRIREINEIYTNTYDIYLDIINRKKYIEYTLRDNVDQRFLFSSLDKYY